MALKLSIPGRASFDQRPFVLDDDEEALLDMIAPPTPNMRSRQGYNNDERRHAASAGPRRPPSHRAAADRTVLSAHAV